MSALLRLAGVMPLMLVVTLVGACQTPPQQAFDRLTYTHLEPISLNAAEVLVVQDYASPMSAPYVEHRFPVRPADAAQQWARDRLRADGGAGTATFTVHEASAREVEVERTEGWRGMFVTEPGERYEAELRVTLAVERGNESARISVTGQRSATLQENATVAQREQAWYDLVRNLMDDINERMERSLRNNSADFLASPMS